MNRRINTRTRPRRKLSPDEQRMQVTRDGSLAALSQHPSWPDFESAMHNRLVELRARATVIALRPSGVNQRELDVIRGSIATILWLLSVPKSAESRLEAYLQAHGDTTEGDEE